MKKLPFFPLAGCVQFSPKAPVITHVACHALRQERGSRVFATVANQVHRRARGVKLNVKMDYVINPFPTLVLSDRTRIYGTVASFPRAVTDRRSIGCVGTVYG